MRARWLLLFAIVLAAACGHPPVQDEVRIEFSEDSDSVVLTAETTFDLNPRNADSRRRVDAARDAAQAGIDPWSVRLGRLTPESERLTFQRSRGALESVTRSVRIPADELHRVFSDVAITINVMRGDGWRELALYAGSSSRASREQQRRFEEELGSWSRDVARYFSAVKNLYAYLDEHPEREKFVFAALLNEKDVVNTEDEEPLLIEVIDAMEKIANRMDQRDAQAESFAEITDLVFNPFPARIVVRTPGDIISIEGFEKSKSDLVIEPVDLFKVIAALEGRWIAPDPLAALLRDEKPTPEQLAAVERKVAPSINASDIASALREQLGRPRNYVVRWRD